MADDHVDLIDPSVRISPSAIIGNPFRPMLGGSSIDYRPTVILAHVFIGHFALIGRGCSIGQYSVLDDFVKLEPNVVVGKRSLIIHRAYLSLGCVVGDDCVVGGFLTDRTQIGNGSRIFGNIVHSHTGQSLGWDDDESQETSAVVGDECFIGFGAQVIGAISISKESYIAANAIVTRDIPPYSLVTGVNQVKPRKGRRDAH